MQSISTTGSAINNRRIFLLGFMGSGKSHWGKIWATQAGLAFFDLDTMIEAVAQMTVAAIFETKGESHFRDMERQLLRSFEGENNFLLSCGGGTPCFNDNMKWMKAAGNTVYLRATPQYIYDRVYPERDKRPVIKNIDPSDLLTFIKTRLQERNIFYEQADLIFAADAVGTDTIQDILHQKL